MRIWKDRKEARQKQLFRTKLYLLAIGLLILGVLLFRQEKGGEEEEPQKEAKKEYETPEKPEEREEPEPEPLEYNSNRK